MDIRVSGQGNDVLTVTVTTLDEDHKFEVYHDSEMAAVDYQETRSWRGQILVSEPSDKVYRTLMTSNELTRYMHEHNLSGVRRAST